jgi:hypothetical protein
MAIHPEVKENVVKAEETKTNNVKKDIVRCPLCHSADVTFDESREEVYYEPFYDDQGKKHEHDENSGCLEIECNACLTLSSTPLPKHLLNRCWCGWVQNQ